MIELADYLNHWRLRYGSIEVPDSELTDQMRADAADIVQRANRLSMAFGKQLILTSGWRPVEVNKLVPHASPNSNHCKCLAADLYDPAGVLAEWCLRQQQVLQGLGLYLEDPKPDPMASYRGTPGWVHVQKVAPKSGKRVFRA